MPETTPQREALPFERDVGEGGRYLYTGGHRLSCRLANARITAAVMAAAPFEGARVIDIGCGDGAYTQELAAVARPAEILGVDPAANAIEVARANRDADRVSFEVASAYELPFGDAEFDLALLRGVVHHTDRPVEALREALRVGHTVVVVEPNGLNPSLKLLERVSAYHRDHGERSHAPHRLDGWVASLGGVVVERQWIGFVPMFAPDWYACAAKRAEPLLERAPGLRRIACAQYVFTARRAATSPPA